MSGGSYPSCGARSCGPFVVPQLETVLKSTPTFENAAKLALNEGRISTASYGARVHAVRLVA